MGDDRWQRVQTIFERAADLPEEERTAFLAAECGADDTLREDVESLLRADSDESLLVGSGLDTVDLLNLDRHLEGSLLGAYRLIERIGVGGMGSVFLAERADGTFERHVAVKVVKKGMDSETVLRRFTMERRILARLDHPNIARLLDGGVTEDGRPYFVMEHVDGLPITEYCDRNRLDIRQRLGLFRIVCGAVHYAHQSLVVHRDLKPSNILVTADGDVKLLDFGIAKLLDDEADTDLTRTGMAVLTPAYASPEQLLQQPVTTASDVYALGVILYELLSGRRPFEVRRTPAEMRRHVLDDAPMKPSTAITQLPLRGDDVGAPTIDELGALRRTPASRLRQSLQGDLDTICLMAIHREPSHRYASADEFATDIGRHLDGLPVIARPDSAAYRVGKFVRRHRAGVAAAVLVVAAFAALVGFYTARLAEERDNALEESRKVAEVVTFVTGLFEVSDPYESRGEEITARELLEAGAQQVDTELADRPRLQATMLRVLADVYYSMGSTNHAEELITTALERDLELYGATHLETATSQLLYGIIRQDNGDYEAAQEYINASLTTRRELLAEESEEVLESLSALAFLEETRGNYADAEVLHADALELARRMYPGDDVRVAEMMSFLAGVYRMQDRPDDAEPLLRDAIAMLDRLYGGEHPLSAKITRQLAGLLRNTARYDEAEPLYEEIIEMQTRMLGPDHHELAVTWNGYSQLLDDIGRTDEALAANQTMIGIVERGANGPHPTLAAAYNNLAFMMRGAGRYDEALHYFELSLEMQDAIGLPPEHPNRSFPIAGIGSVYLRQGRYDEAVPIQRDVLERRREAFGEEHRLTSEAKSELAATLIRLEEYDEAETLLLDAYERFSSDRRMDDPRTVRAAERLAELYEATGQPERAAEYAAIAAAADDGDD